MTRVDSSPNGCQFMLYGTVISLFFTETHIDA